MVRIRLILSIGAGALLACGGPVQDANHEGQLEQAKDMSGVIQVRALWDALTLYRQHMGDYPSAEMGLGALTPTANPPFNWKGPYIARVPLDAWQRPFRYHRDDEGIGIFSAGPDGALGTEDDIGEMRPWSSL